MLHLKVQIRVPKHFGLLDTSAPNKSGIPANYTVYFWASSAFAPLRPLACGVGVGVGGAGIGGRSGGEEGGSETADRHEDAKKYCSFFKKNSSTGMFFLQIMVKIEL